MTKRDQVLFYFLEFALRMGMPESVAARYIDNLSAYNLNALLFSTPEVDGVTLGPGTMALQLAQFCAGGPVMTWFEPYAQQIKGA